MTRIWACAAGLAGLLLFLLAVVLTAGDAWAKPGKVTTKQGEVFEGDVTENPKTVKIVTKRLGPVVLQKDNVKSVEYDASPKEEFAQRLAKLEKDDVEGRIELARWAVDRKEFDLAVEALDGAVAIDPNNEEAIQMQRAVLKARKLRPATARAAPEPAEGEQPPRAAPAGAGAARPAPDAKAGPKKFRPVTLEEINRIKQGELAEGEKINVRLENDVKRRYMNALDVDPKEFAKLTPAEQAFEILANGNRRLHEDVIITTDPASLTQFKSHVQRYVVPGCASLACHAVGSKNAGDFVLYSPAAKDPETYTNFLLMQDYVKKIDDKEYRLIDRARPQDSLLFLYGLPQAESDLPHPKTQNFQPLFKGEGDARYKQMFDWLSRTLAPIAPDYGVDLSQPPPKAKPPGPGGREPDDDADAGDVPRSERDAGSGAADTRRR